MSHTQSSADPIEALHQDAKRFPGIPADPTLGKVPDGITGIAKLIGRSAGVLHNKFSESEEKYALNVREAMAIAQVLQKTTGATGFIEALALSFGGLFIPLPPEGEAADDDVLAALLDSIRSLGDLARELHEAREDGIITREEFSAIELRARRLQATIHSAVQILRTQVQEDPNPVPLRIVR